MRGMHASAPPAHLCSDCTMHNEACPRCYTKWWQTRHPHTHQMVLERSSNEWEHELRKLLTEASERIPDWSTGVNTDLRARIARRLGLKTLTGADADGSYILPRALRNKAGKP